MLRRLLLVAAVAILAACGSEAVDVVGEAPPTTAVPTDEPTPTEPAPTPTLGESPLPVDRPADFEASFSQDAGMAPWAEDITVTASTAVYEVWMEGVEYSFLHTPAPERIDALYNELRAGRFDLYEVIPFGDDEMIYDAESTSWRVRAGDFSHRVGASGEDIVGPSNGRRPLGALSGFSDLDAVPGATFTATILVDDGVAQRWGTDLFFDLGSADFAMGEDRWTQELVVSFSESPVEVPVIIRLNADSDEPVETTMVVTFVDGGTIRVGTDARGGVSVS